MIHSQDGFTLLETLVALVIATMGIVAVGQLIGGAARSESNADAVEKAAELADLALEAALLPVEASRKIQDDAIRNARADGWTLTITRRSGPLPGCDEIVVVVSGAILQMPFELHRLVPAVEAAVPGRER